MMSGICGSNKTAQHATIDLLKDTLGDRLISRFGPVNWPPRSCDLTPLDYFLWGYVKSLVYADKPQTLDHLEDNIRRVIADMRPQMLEKVIENWTSRLDYIRASRGSPMQKSYLKLSSHLSLEAPPPVLLSQSLYIRVRNPGGSSTGSLKSKSRGNSVANSYASIAGGSSTGSLKSKSLQCGMPPGGLTGSLQCELSIVVASIAGGSSTGSLKSKSLQCGIHLNSRTQYRRIYRWRLLHRFS
ncbi:hypothetical protein TNCV_207781 [Trichonephila clavipes]|nr:hypothetical protein TNCV_207781 [Trichonephila clavipes]